MIQTDIGQDRSQLYGFFPAPVKFLLQIFKLVRQFFHLVAGVVVIPQSLDVLSQFLVLNLHFVQLDRLVISSTGIRIPRSIST